MIRTYERNQNKSNEILSGFFKNVIRQIPQKIAGMPGNHLCYVKSTLKTLSQESGVRAYPSWHTSPLPCPVPNP